MNCSEGSDADVCHITVTDDSTDGGLINLESPRKALKCVLCEMYALTEIICENCSLVETIDFSRCRINNLSNKYDNYSDFINVRVFNLSHNEIHKFLVKYNFLITTSKKLTTLDLSYNNIEIVPSDGLDYSSMQMTDLYLSHNKIVSLETDCF